MKRPPLIVIGLAVSGLAAAAAVALWQRGNSSPVLTGYVEGEPLYLAAPVAGTVRRVSVARGDRVAAGQTLFVVDPAQVDAQAGQARAELALAQAQANDAARGQRPVELAVLDAGVAQAEAGLRDAEADLGRIEPLVRQGWYAPARLDNARAGYDAARARLTASRRQREAAALGARTDQVRAASARIAQAQAAVAGAEARRMDVAPRAPADARVEDVFFQPGEWAPANQPILSLLPDDRITLRFFVPEAARTAYAVGRTVRFTCDGCPSGLTAKITFMSPRPEFTPPVIYARDTRDRLVYQVHARPSTRLAPGQPVDVAPIT